ncbi:MAG TPA: tripartite tricarboxylate transporter substrate binding protein [Pseudolabrys sp.]|nr:tripartite tricarboxylate transporter substrate binding protein [Pseudolabrys sp.]
MRPTRQLLIGLLSLLAIVPIPQRAWAQYPAHDKRITFVVPFSAGGSNDILARVIGQTLSNSWHIPVTIINQVGASGSLGAARVAKAEPDGYTLLMLSSTYTINSAVMTSLPFDPKTSFAAVSMLGKAPMMLAVSKRVPIENAKELIALARSKPGDLNYGSAGIGSVNHMSMELLKSMAGLDIKHVPYRAGNEAVNDMIGGHLDMFIGSLPQMMEVTRGGLATPIAVTGPQRSSIAPDLPTIAESGVPDYELEQWWGIVVPAGTPPDIIKTLNTEFNAILATPEVRAFMTREGAQPSPSTPEAFGAHLAAELKRWNELVQKIHVNQ